MINFETSATELHCLHQNTSQWLLSTNQRNICVNGLNS